MSLGLPIGSALFVTPASAQVGFISVDFRTALEPYGSFRRVARWGEVWVPNVAPDWRPYTVGRWVYSDDYGWYWVSDAPEADWGWVAFHYGRWVSERGIGSNAKLFNDDRLHRRKHHPSPRLTTFTVGKVNQVRWVERMKAEFASQFQR